MATSATAATRQAADLLRPLADDPTIAPLVEALDAIQPDKADSEGEDDDRLEKALTKTRDVRVQLAKSAPSPALTLSLDRLAGAERALQAEYLSKHSGAFFGAPSEERERVRKSEKLAA